MRHFPVTPQQEGRVARLTRFISLLGTSLSDISDAFEIPVVRAITGGITRVLEQKTLLNKRQSMTLLERIHGVFCILLQLLVTSRGVLTPDLFDLVLQLVGVITLINTHLSVRDQGGKIRRLISGAATSASIADCESHLERLMRVFHLALIARAGSLVGEMSTEITARQRQTMELVEDIRDCGSISSMPENSISSSSSAEALSLVPATPKIFHGREHDLETLVSSLLHSPPARIAILGASGMGKTSLAVAALHNVAVVGAFPQRYFISCEAVQTVQDMVVAILTHVGLPWSQDPKRSVLRYLAELGPCILILDNFETPWEAERGDENRRTNIESFLGLLAEIKQLALVITMRGGERPAGVQWTRPFFPTLQPLDNISARRVFVDIADEPVDDEEEAAMEGLLASTDNLPLAINLLAHAAAFEGYTTTLRRCRNDDTEFLTQGYDKTSSLEKSINLSLGSPRMRASPEALALLSLLSLLPDGLAEKDLGECERHIPRIWRCRSALLRTALAFVGADRRLRVLAPIRDYISKQHPPERHISDALQAHMCGFLTAWSSNVVPVQPHLVHEISTNLANIRSLIQHGISEADRACRTDAEVLEMGHQILRLDVFLFEVYRGTTDQLDQLAKIVERTADCTLQGQMICSRLNRGGSRTSPSEAEILIKRGISLFRQAATAEGEAQLYNSATRYYLDIGDLSQAARLNARSLAMPNSGDVQRLGALLDACGLALNTSRHRQSIILAEEAQCAAQRIGNMKLEAKALQIQADGCVWLGKLSQALQLCQEARQCLAKCGLQNSVGEIALLDIEAFVHLQRTDYQQSRATLEGILRIASPSKFDRFYANTTANVIRIDLILGTDITEILRRLEDLIEFAGKLSSPQILWYCALIRAEVFCRSGNRKEAISEFRRCLEYFRASYGVGVSVCFRLLADVYTEEGDFVEAFRWAVTNLAQARTTGILDTLHALRQIGDVLTATGDEETAATLYGVVLDTFSEMDVMVGRAECLVRLGVISLNRGCPTRARKQWSEARNIFKGTGLLKQADELSERIGRFGAVTNGGLNGIPQKEMEF